MINFKPYSKLSIKPLNNEPSSPEIPIISQNKPSNPLNKTVPKSTPILNDDEETIEILKEEVGPEEYTAGENLETTGEK